MTIGANPTTRTVEQVRNAAVAGVTIEQSREVASPVSELELKVRVCQCSSNSHSQANLNRINREPGVHQPRHAKQGQAMSDRIIITIDGPAATGKSSVAQALARRLGFDFLDTGAMYRAAALIAIEANLWTGSTPKHDQRTCLVSLIHTCQLEFDWSTQTPTLQRDGRSVMHRLRDDDVTAAVGPISGIAELRQIMVAKQQAIGDSHPRLVSEGRDQGAVVFPNAAVKFYLDADPEVRASRRRDQMLDRHQRHTTEHPDQPALPPPPSVETIRDELLNRDRADAAEGRLLRPSDAIVVDTTRLNFHEVVSTLERLVRERVGEIAAG